MRFLVRTGALSTDPRRGREKQNSGLTEKWHQEQDSIDLIGCSMRQNSLHGIRPAGRGRVPRTGGTMVLAGVLAVFGMSARGTQSAFVRVNQLGYEASCDGRAYLMATGAESGAIVH